MQVTVVIHVKSILSSPNSGVHMQIQKEIKPIDPSLWCVCPAASVDCPVATAQAASLTAVATPPDLKASTTTADAPCILKPLHGAVHPKSYMKGLRARNAFQP